MSVDIQCDEQVRRARDFQLYWVAGAIDRLGSQASGIAFPLMTLAVTGSPTATGLVGALGLAGRVAVAPVAGVLADRVPRRRMMVTALMVAAATMGVVFVAVVTDALTTLRVAVVVLSTTAFVEGIAQACYGAAGSSALRGVLPTDDQRALARLEARNHAVQIVGPVFGGALYQLARWVPFLADALSYAVAAGLVALVRADLTPQRADRASFREDLRDGLRFVWRHPFLRFVTVWAAGINFVLCALLYGAILTSGRRGAPPVSIGLILTIASLGGLTGALLAPRILGRVRPRTVIVSASWAMVAVVAVLSQARQTWSYGLLFGLVCLFSPVLGIIFQSRTIMLTPDRMQGRMAMVMSTTGELVAMPAPLIAGVLVARFSPAAVALVFAAILALLAGYTMANLRLLAAGAPADGER
jgi:predicted MFS family arabinose efflux permease